MLGATIICSQAVIYYISQCRAPRKIIKQGLHNLSLNDKSVCLFVCLFGLSLQLFSHVGMFYSAKPVLSNEDKVSC